MNYFFYTLISVAVTGLLLLMVNQWLRPNDCLEENSGKLPGIVGAIIASILIVSGFFGIL